MDREKSAGLARFSSFVRGAVNPYTVGDECVWSVVWLCWCSFGRIGWTDLRCSERMFCIPAVSRCTIECLEADYAARLSWRSLEAWFVDGVFYPDLLLHQHHPHGVFCRVPAGSTDVLGCSMGFCDEINETRM